MDEAKKYMESMKQMATPPAVEYRPLLPKDSYVVIIPREKWEADAPGGKLKPSRLPATCVYFTYLSGLYPDDWRDMGTSKKSIKKMQSFHMAKGLPDIPYNFLITSDCRIYEGRGWKFRPDVKEKPFSVLDIAFATEKDFKSNLSRMFKIMETGLQLVHYGIQEEFVCIGYITRKRHVDEAATFDR